MQFGYLYVSNLNYLGDQFHNKDAKMHTCISFRL